MDLLIKDVELPKRGELLTLTVRWTGHTWANLRNYKGPDVVRVTEAVEVNKENKDEFMRMAELIEKGVNPKDLVKECSSTEGFTYI